MGLEGHQPSSPPGAGVPDGKSTTGVESQMDISPAEISPDGWGTPRPMAARARSRIPSQVSPKVPPPGRPYLTARPRVTAAVAGRETRSRGAARPWPGTCSVEAAAAAVLCLPGGRAGAAAGERGSDGKRRGQPDRRRPTNSPL